MSTISIQAIKTRRVSIGRNQHSDEMLLTLCQINQLRRLLNLASIRGFPTKPRKTEYWVAVNGLFRIGTAFTYSISDDTVTIEVDAGFDDAEVLP